MDKPRVLILGGCGFIGRHLVSHLVDNDLASAIRVVDKVPIKLAWPNKKCLGDFSQPIVEFKSANLINPESCKTAFQCPEMHWDYVINCAGETKWGQSDKVYEEGIFQLSTNCAKESSHYKIKHYIELSSGKMNSKEKTPQKEDDPVAPWTYIGKWKNKVETSLTTIPNLPFTVLRLATVYGKGDRLGLTPRIIAASIYQYLGETMKLLWNEDLKIATVHIDDVVSAIWFICTRSDTIGQVYNVVDDADSTQGSITSLLSALFRIKADYCGNLVSNLMDLEAIADDANDKHSVPWAAVCKLDNIEMTPLSPHMDSEQLVHKHLRLDGNKLKSLGFALSRPSPSVDSFAEVIDDFVEMGVFPATLVP